MLHRLSGLAAPQSGTMESRKGGETITLRTGTTKTVGAAAKLPAICVRYYTTQGGVVSGGKGTLYDGHFVANGDEMTGLARVDSPDAKAVLVAFKNEDVMDCAESSSESSSSIPYSVQNSLMPLAPTVEAAQDVWSGKKRLLLVACVNGLFVLQGASRKARATEPRSSAALYRNILEEVSLILDLRSSAGVAPPPRGFITRLGRNALAILKERDQVTAVETLQRELGVPVYPNARSLAERASTDQFDASLSLLDVSGAIVNIDALKKVAADLTSVRAEPLAAGWKKPETIFHAELVLSRSANGGTSSEDAAPPRRETSTFARLLAGGEVGLEIGVDHPPFRATRPGETSLRLDRQLEQVVTDALASKLGGAREHDADWLASTTKECRKQVQDMLKDSQIFPDSATLKASLSLSQARHQGTLIELPSGLKCLVPQYAEHADQARLNALLGVLRHLHVAVRFVPWDSSRNRTLFV